VAGLHTSELGSELARRPIGWSDSCSLRDMLAQLRTVSMALLLACSSPGSSPRPASVVHGDPLAGRTYSLKVPAGYDGSRPLPLVVALHGYGGDAKGIEGYFGLDAVADAHGFFVVYPDGTVDEAGHRFFTSTDACCDFYGTGVDDVAFIGALLDRIEATYAIDKARVYSVGHSNGGFMSYRLACDLSDRFAAIVSLEGAMWLDPSHCRPSSPVAVLEVHGTDDFVIPTSGGDVVDGYANRTFPSVVATLASWQSFDGTGPGARAGPDPGSIDSETMQGITVQQWSGRADVELWMILGGTHGPALTPAWPEALYGFLMAHPKGSGQP
jgi:polyhydroxybutyrate depolymerase